MELALKVGSGSSGRLRPKFRVQVRVWDMERRLKVSFGARLCLSAKAQHSTKWWCCSPLRLTALSLKFRVASDMESISAALTLTPDLHRSGPHYESEKGSQ